MKNRVWPMLMLASCILALMSCGFHLRGQVDLPDSLSAIYIQGGLPSSPMREILRQKLVSAGVEVVQKQSDATASLIIHKDETTRREVSLNEAGQPDEYELNYQLSYSLMDEAGDILVPAQSLSQLRTYQFDASQILLMEDEERRIIRKMATTAVSQMLRRISTLLRRQQAAQIGDQGADQNSGQNKSMDKNTGIENAPVESNP